MRARQPHAARRGLRDGDGQLQPRDGVDRLRHVEPALLRAAHPRGRARGLPRRARRRAGRRRDRAARRPDAPRSRPAAQGRRRAHRRHQPGGHPPRRGAGGLRSRPGRGGAARAGARHSPPASRRPWRSPTASATRCSCGRRTSSAVVAWRSCTTRRCCGDYIDRATAGEPGAPGARRQVPRRCRRDRRRRALRRRTSSTSPASWSTSRRPASTPATRPAPCRRSPWGTSDIDRIRRSTEAIATGVGVRGLLNVQFALAGDILYVLEANPRASRTVPFVVEGDGGAAREGCGARHDGRHRSPSCAPRACSRPWATAATLPIGAPIAVKEAVLPFGRFHGVDTVLGPGDALDRRGHGHRLGVRHGVRQVPDRGVLRRAAHQRPGVRLGGQPRQALDGVPGEAPGRPRFRDPGHGGHRRGAAAQRPQGHRRCASSTTAVAPTASRPRSTRSSRATSTSS